MTISIKREKSSTCDIGEILAFDDLDDDSRRAGQIGYLNYRKYKSYFIHAGIFINPDYRKQGIGTKMYKELCKIAKECNIEKVYGQTSNPNALKARVSVFPNTEFGIGIVPSELKLVDKMQAIEHLDKQGSIWMISEVEGCEES